MLAHTPFMWASSDESPISSSGSSTANGSSPIASLAQPTAWPSPRGSSWYTIVARQSDPMLRTRSASAVLPLASSAAMISGDGAK